MLEVVKSQVALLDEGPATARPRTLVRLDRVVSAFVFLHITSSDERFATTRMGAHVILLAGVRLPVIIQ